ncbi:SusC/RagA family TonB-linked outer membrane protein [Mucilaginibacter sabulilitoris]|uniref:SusC/RagA family TonB-linked outer membrane protein n=1 Tax=Mucilaginibacter sabulilitoris TaxID=1173583 RepID=A0ABZ0TJW9_9SPHI|nr:SusC/RagA family TonB-linked outer membrane protein [Mucilaginibacter sabulilitoris]WPU92014.1 SusC/RagA family TonB-linked outer membrane protein [Mucilaginibacter sabulilitoris]
MKQLKRLLFTRKKLFPVLLLLLFSVMVKAQVNPSDQYSFEKKRTSVQEIVNTLKSKYGYKVSFEADVKMSSLVTLPQESLSFDGLAQVLQQQAGIGIKNINGNLVIKKLDMILVSGTVMSADDKSPLPGVSVSDNAKKLLAFTTNEGKFSVQVASGTAINFSTVGYAAQNQVFNKTTTGVTITLSMSNSTLNEVVVTALGIKRDEKALGYAATVVKGEQLTQNLSNNWTDALSGKVAGLNLIRSNAGPTGSNRIVLRGESNLSGDNEALIVVDGVVINNGSGRTTGSGSSSYLDGDSPVDFGSGLNDINPSDIENITVLKGPGAAALYGQRGANGAIIITTKSGKTKDGKINVTINSNAAIEDISRWPDFQYEYGQGVGGANYYSFGATADGASTRSTSSAWGPKFDGQSYFQYDPVTHTGATVRTPWVAYPNARKDFFTSGKTFTNSVSLNGGTDKTSARFSATNVDNTWIIPNTGYKRNTVALAVDQKVSDKLQISTRINYTNKTSDNLPATGYNNQSVMYWNMFWEPNAPASWLKDYWLPGQTNIKQSFPFSSYPDNPYLIANEMNNKLNRNGLTGNIQVTYNFTKNLSLMVRTALDFANDQRSEQRPYDTEKFLKGMYRTQSVFSQEITNDFLIHYKQNIGKDIELNLTGGGSMLKNTYNRDELRADSLLYPGVYTLANKAGILSAIPLRSKYAINSFYGVFAASYKNYLFLDVTGRNDWSSILASPTSTSNVSFFYPSVNGSAILSEIFKMPEAISYAKVRGSYAGVGSGRTDPYLTSYSYAPVTDFPGGLANPTKLANINLKPLYTTSYELGTEWRLFNSRLGFDLTLYTSKTKDQILTATVDRASGVSAAIINAGAVRNQGIEIAVNGSPIKVKNGFNWSINATFSANKNKVLSLTDSLQNLTIQTGPGSRGAIIAYIGGGMGDLYGRGYERSPDGQIVYENGYPVITNDMKYIGSTTPKWKASLGNQFNYKNFSLSFLVDAQHGAVAYSLTSAILAEQGKSVNTLPGRYNGIIGNGVVKNADGTYSPNTVIAQDLTTYYTAHYGKDNVEGTTYSTDFLKLREARFDYTLPQTLLRRLGLTRVTIGVYGRDLITITKWPGFDPEFGTLNDNYISQGFELGQFPSTRTYGVNLTIGI